MLLARLAGTIVLALGVSLSLVGPAHAQESRDAVRLDAVMEPNTLLDADALLLLWGRKLGVAMFYDQQMVGTKVRLPSGDLTWGTFKKVLDFNDIVLDQKEVLGQTLIFAHLRRNFPCKLGPPFPLVSAEEAAKHADEVVTTVLTVKHGGGNDIFATVRGLLVRDVNRIGNILYVRGPEAIILVDFGANIAYYARVIAALDVPGAGARVFDLAHSNAEDTALVLDPLADPGTKVVPAPRTNQVVVRGTAAELARMADLVAKVDVPTGSARPRHRADTGGVALWKIATAFAAVAFVGQTILLRRFQRRSLLTKLSV